MYLLLARLIAAGLFACQLAAKDDTVALPPSNGGTLSEISAAPSKGFNFPYLLWVPSSKEVGPPTRLLVETNNTGRPDDDLQVHRKSAIEAASGWSVGSYVATALRIPLLVPVFPRPKSIEDTYTHSLDRDTMVIAKGPLRRLDLQLLSMIADARARLATLGKPVQPKILLNGFSASGLFANRFTYLHPGAVAAACYGGVNGFVMLPQDTLEGKNLNFPVGTKDLEMFADSGALAEFRRLPQMAYMGEKDENDAVMFDDAYSEDERGLILTLVGKQMMPTRWNAVKKFYNEYGVNAEFRTYGGIGHGTDRRINDQVTEFFRSHLSD